MTLSRQDQEWQEIYDTREAFFARHVGGIPEYILSLGHLTGVWPGGGLLEIKADKLGKNVYAYTTCGLCNNDMPTQVYLDSSESTPAVAPVAPEEDAAETKTDKKQTKKRKTKKKKTAQDEKNSTDKPEAKDTSEAAIRGTLRRKQHVPSYPGRPGYGYELMMLTPEPAEWPLWFLQWAVNIELLDDADLLGRVEEYGGLTLGDITVGEFGYVNVLIQPASGLLPAEMKLPNGVAKILVATIVTDDEIAWSLQNSREALAEELVKAGVGQISDSKRASLFHPDPVDYTKQVDQTALQKLHEQGLIRQVYLFPPELGGADVPENITYLPREAALRKMEIDQSILPLVQDGRITHYATDLDYKDESRIPSALHITLGGEAGFKHTIEVW